MSAPQVYRAITAIAAELSGAGIAKRHRNERDDYRYRSIDDVLNKLSPLLAKHKLCALPRVLERTTADRTGDGDLLLVNVILRIAFDLVSSSDGSSHTVEAFGEALDPSDKATAKAMSSAYKHAMLQVFCVPVAQIEDADASSHRLKRSRTHEREPVEGWAMWTSGTIDIIESCTSTEAVERLRERQRPLLTGLSREKPDLYAQLGAAFARRTSELNSDQGTISRTTSSSEPCADRKSETARNKPPVESRARRSRKRGEPAEQADGEECAIRRTAKQATDASITAPEPA
jgi:hypothetical protein